MSGRTRKAIMSLFAVAAIFHLVQSAAIAEVSKDDAEFYNGEMKTIIDYLASFGGDKGDPKSPAGAAKLLAEKLANGQINYRDDLPPGELGENNWPNVEILHLSVSAFPGSSRTTIKLDPQNPIHAKSIALILSTLYHELVHSLNHTIGTRISSNLLQKRDCGSPMEVEAHTESLLFMLRLADIRWAQFAELSKKSPKDPKIVLILEEIVAFNSAAGTELGAIFENNYNKDEAYSKKLVSIRGTINRQNEALRNHLNKIKKAAEAQSADKKNADQSSVPQKSILKSGRMIASVTPDLKSINNAAAAQVETACKPKTAVAAPPSAARKKKKKVTRKKAPRRTVQEAPSSAPVIQFGIGFGGSPSHHGGGGQHHQEGGRVGGR